MFEGTGVYFWLLFLWILAIYITSKVALGSLFKRMNESAWKAYIPFYGVYVLTKILRLKMTVFLMGCIPFINLHYYNIIIKEMLKEFEMNPEESIMFLLIPMYKFPEMVFKKPKFRAHEYDLTRGFVETENIIFTPVNDAPNQIPNDINNMISTDGTPANINNMVPIDENMSNNIPDINPSLQGVTINQEPTFTTPEVNESPSIEGPENVFTNQNLQTDKSHLTYVEAPEEKPEEPQQPTMRALDTGKPQICPNCGTKLAPSATTCFFCGTKLQ